MERGNIILYDDKPNIEIRLDNDTIWLNQRQMADLFDKDSDACLTLICLSDCTNIICIVKGYLDKTADQWKNCHIILVLNLLCENCAVAFAARNFLSRVGTS